MTLYPRTSSVSALLQGPWARQRHLRGLGFKQTAHLGPSVVFLSLLFSLLSYLRHLILFEFSLMGNWRWLIKDNPVLCAAGPPVWEPALCHYLPRPVVGDKRRSGRPAQFCTLSSFQAFNWACNYKNPQGRNVAGRTESALFLCLPPLETPAKTLTLKSFRDFFYLFTTAGAPEGGQWPFPTHLSL